MTTTAGAPASVEDASVEIVNQRCEYLVDPIGIDIAAPRLFWQLRSDLPGIRPTHTLVEVTTEDGTPVWSSSVAQATDLQITYAGPTLLARTGYRWSVTTTFEGPAGEHLQVTSPAARFEMGLLAPLDWSARLIEPNAVDAPIDPDTGGRPALRVRRAFSLPDRPIARARLYITAHGVYEAGINGRRVGEDLLTPGWTTYQRHLQYQTYDVTDLVTPGDNAIGITLADGWYRGHVSYINVADVYGTRVGAYAQLEVTHLDGSTTTVVTDDAWRCARSPITSADLFNGEHHDARLDTPGWDAPGFDDRSWRPVTPAHLDPKVLVAPRSTAVRRTEELRPVPIGGTILDLGQNISGVVRVTATAPAGHVITLRHAEVLDADGKLYTAPLRMARCTDRYTFAGTGAPETFEPRFTTHGFRYVEIEGLPADAEVTALVTHTELRPSGTFECSDERVNQLWRNVVWTQRDNMVDVPTDCPQRDERMGWTADLAVFARAAVMNMDMAAFITRWLRDLRSDQWANGLVPMVVPDAFTNRRDMLRRVVRNAVSRREGDTKGPFDEYAALFHLNGAVGWGDAAISIPWDLHEVYGDRRILEESYASMCALYAFRRRRGRFGRWWAWRFPRRWRRAGFGEAIARYTPDWFGFGDWLAPDHGMNGSILRSRDYLPTMYMAINARIIARTAEALGLAEEAAEWRAEFEAGAAAWRTLFMDRPGRIRPHRQTPYVLALAHDLLPESDRAAAADELARLVAENGFRLQTGFLGTPMICRVLADHGHAEVAYRLLLNDQAQWLLQIGRGATTIWEHWDNIRADGSFVSDRMLSFNHYAYGAVASWLYDTVAGIRPDPTRPGFEHTFLQPTPGGGLTWARAGYESVRGRVACGWSIEGDTLTIDAEVPPASAATLTVPEGWSTAITLNGAPVDGPTVTLPPGRSVLTSSGRAGLAPIAT